MATVQDQVRKLLERLTPEMQRDMVMLMKQKNAIKSMEFVLDFLEQWESDCEVDGLIISVLAEVLNKSGVAIVKLGEKYPKDDTGPDGYEVGSAVIGALLKVVDSLRRDLPQPNVATCCSVHSGGHEECRD